MTALNGFVIGEAAYLSADAAVWQADGAIREHRRKLIVVEAAQTVFAAKGIFAHRLLELLATDCRDLEDVHELCARFAASNARRVAEEDDWSEWKDRATVTFTGAAWYDGEPTLWAVDADAHGDLEPRGFKGLRVSPLVDWSLALGRSVQTREDVQALDPRKAAVDIMRAQRTETHDTAAGPLHCVGGWCDLATVTAAGIKIETLCRWNDPLGKRITP